MSATLAPPSAQRPLPTTSTRGFSTSRPLVEAVPGAVSGLPSARALSAVSYHSASSQAGSAELPRLRNDLREAEGEVARLRAEALVLKEEAGKVKEELQEKRTRLEDRETELEQTRSKLEQTYVDRDEAAAAARAAQDDGPASELAAAERETARLRHEMVNLRLRILEVQRNGGCSCRGNCHMEFGAAARLGDEAVGHDLMARIASGRTGRICEADEEEADATRDWRTQEIARLEMLLGGEHEARVQLEGAVEHLVATLDRRDEEEKRSSSHMEGRRRMAEERLRAVTRLLLHAERERREAAKVVGDVQDSPLDVRHGLQGEEGLWAEIGEPSTEIWLGATEGM